MKTSASFHSFESLNPDLFASYVELRRRVFHLHYDGLSDDFGMPDETDRASHIVYTFQGSKFAGGARLTISTPQQPRQLPLEECGFRLLETAALSHLNLDRQPYAEISRMAIDPACSHALEASADLAVELCRVAARLAVDKIFSICPAGAVRLNRRNAASLQVGFAQYPRIATAYGRDMWLCAFTNILRVGAGVC